MYGLPIPDHCRDQPAPQQAIDLQDRNGWTPFVCLQPLDNVLDREAEWELLPLFRHAGLGGIGWSLPTDQVDRLTAVSERDLPYPYNVITEDPARI